MPKLGLLNTICKGLVSNPAMAGVAALNPTLMALICVGSGIAMAADIVLDLRQVKETNELRGKLDKLRAGQALAGDEIARAEGLNIDDLPPNDLRRFHLIMHRFLKGEFDQASDGLDQLTQQLLDNQAAIEAFFEQNTEKLEQLFAMQLHLQFLAELTLDEVKSIGFDVRELNAKIDSLTPAPSLEFFPTADTGNRFVYRQQRVPLFGRESEMQALRDFLMFDPGEGKVTDFRWWLWTGPGGIGKSRLAWELCLEAETYGWKVGFLRNDTFQDWRIDRPTLMIVDYVAQRPEQVSEILLKFTQDSFRVQQPLRILMLERSADEQRDDWLRRLMPKGSTQSHPTEMVWNPAGHKDRLHLDKYILQVPGLSNEALWNTMTAVWEDMEREGNESINRPQREECLQALEKLDPAKRPLFAALTAEAIAQRGMSTIRQWKDPQQVAELILELEFERWWKTCLKEWGDTENDAFRQEFESHLNLILFATMTGRQSSEIMDWLHSEGEEKLWLPEEIRPSWLRIMTGYTLDAGEVNAEAILPLEPDMLGELLILERFAGRLVHDSRTTKLKQQIRQLRNLAWRRSPLDTATFLRRAATDFPGHAELTELLNLDKTALKFPEERQDEWASGLVSLGFALWERPLGNRSENLQKTMECYTAALRVHTEADFPQDWAITQNNLGIAHQNLPTGDRGENLQQAIGFYTAALRVCTETDFPQDWAMTSANVAFVLRIAAKEWQPEWSQYGWEQATLWQAAEDKLVHSTEAFERIGHQHNAKNNQRLLKQLRQERGNQS